MDLAPLAVAVPLVAAAGMTAVAPLVKRGAAETIALVASAAVVVLCALLVAESASGLDVYWFSGWEPRDGIAVGVSFATDLVGAGLATLVAVLVVAGLVIMTRYRDADPPHFQSLMLLFLAGMVGFVLSGDLFNMFVFFELMSVAAFALSGYKVEEREALEGSLSFAVTNTIGSFLLLSGIALTYGRTGALNLAQIGDALGGAPADGLVAVAFALLVAGFLVKAAVVPFHFWLADAYAVAPTPVCLVFAGAMSELGIYAVARLAFTAFGDVLAPHEAELRAILVGAGAITALGGAVMCFAQHHLKRLLAFATISYVGVFLVGAGLLVADGIAGTAVYVVADGLGKAALFAAVGILQHRRGSVSERRLHRQGRDLPFTGLLFAAGALSFAAVPPFGTFIGKSLIEAGLIDNGFDWVIPVLMISTALTAGAVLRVGARIFLGWGHPPPGGPTEDEGPELEEPSDRTPAVMFVPAALMLVGAAAIGVVPEVRAWAADAAAAFTDGAGYGAAVLTGAPSGAPSAPEPPPPEWYEYLYSGLALAGGSAAAAAALFPDRLRNPATDRVGRLVARHLLDPVRAAHSGHVGDYVTWVVFGIAVLGGLFGLALT
jgi:multicomponent Na+:H+ antiporter subunit D